MSDMMITRDMDTVQKDQLFELVSDRFPELLWDKIFYVSSVDPAGSAISNGQTYADSDTTDGALLNLGNQARFRCSVNLLTLTSSTQFWISSFHTRPVDGSYTIGKDTGEYAAFKIEDNKLFATTFTLGKETKTLLEKSVTQGQDLILEMRFFPRERVDFYVNKEYRASLSDNLPNNTKQAIYDLAHYYSLSGNLDVQTQQFMQQTE